MKTHKDITRDGSPRCNLARWRTLNEDEFGSTAIIFALTLVPLIGFGGLALDYSRASLGQVNLQSAVDSAGLAVAHLPSDTSVAVVEQKALEWVNAKLAGRDVGPVTLTAARVGKKITFTATTTIETTLFRILRKEPVTVTASNEVTWSIGKVEVALVLDNTGSMVQNHSPKLANLKTAAKSLVDKLETAAADAGQVKVGVVPFSMTVNVGSQYAKESWMDKGASPLNKEIFYGAENEHQNRFTLFEKLGQTWGGCVEGRAIPYDVQDTPPDTTDPKSLFVPYFAPDEPDKPDDDAVNNYLKDGVNPRFGNNA